MKAWIKNLFILVMLVGMPGVTSYAQSNATATLRPLAHWWHRSFSSLSWEQVITAVESPRAICWQVRRHIRYLAEDGDQWFSGRTVWNRGYGDCEDFAMCVADLCEAKDFPCWIAMVFPVGSRSQGHCVTMGIWQGQMWLASNGLYVTVSSLDDALKKLSAMRRGAWQGKQLEFVPLSLL